MLMAKAMPFKTILVGDNGSPDAERAVRVALALGQSLKAKVILLGVLTPPSAESQAEGYGLEPLAERGKGLEAKLNEIAQSANQSGAEVVTEIVEGEPGKAIQRRAEQDAVDLIVVGRRDGGRVRHWLEGSTSEDLVRGAHTSVLVVHDVHGEE